jgi:hypothetical protein
VHGELGALFLCDLHRVSRFEVQRRRLKAMVGQHRSETLDLCREDECCPAKSDGRRLAPRLLRRLRECRRADQANGFLMGAQEIIRPVDAEPATECGVPERFGPCERPAQISLLLAEVEQVVDLPTPNPSPLFRSSNKLALHHKEGMRCQEFDADVDAGPKRLRARPAHALVQRANPVSALVEQRGARAVVAHGGWCG